MPRYDKLLNICKSDELMTARVYKDFGVACFCDLTYDYAIEVLFVRG